MSIQEMATSLLEGSIDEVSSVESEVFAAYASNYIENAVGRICKGCHGG